MVIASAACIALSLLVVCGCTSGRKAGSSADAARHEVAQETTALGRLDRDAAREAAEPLQPREVPVPPGVEPATLSPRDPADRRAWLPLDQAVAELAAQRSPPPAEAAAPANPESQAAALRAYSAGRQAALEGRHLVAITELRRAADLDPSSPEILRELARSYQAMRNSSAAAATYEKLMQLAPEDADAALSLAVHTANQRDAEQAAAALARVMVDEGEFPRSSGADLVASYVFSQCLRQLGYDRASLESARSMLSAEMRPLETGEYQERLASIYRQRGELWRGVGDAHCRLGEYQQALEAYRVAASLPTADAAALPPRVLYANLRMGRTNHAKRELLASLQSHSSSLSDQDVRLCAYIGDFGGQGGPLAEAVAEMYRASPDDQALACAAAALLSGDDAVMLLREFVQRRPNDRAALAQLLTWLDRRDPAAAVELAVSLAEAQPEHAVEFGQLLAAVSARPGASLQAMSRTKASAARSLLTIVLLESVDADGAAWTAAQHGSQAWPDDPRFLRYQLELAAALQEPALLDPLLPAATAQGDARTLAAAAIALQATDQSELAAEFARQAADRGGDDPRVHVALARLYRARAGVAASEVDRRAAAEQTVRAAERVIARDASTEDAYELLLTLYQEDGLLSDQRQLMQTVRRLETALPEGRLMGLLKVQDALARQRDEQALELALRLYGADMTHEEALLLAVDAWRGLDRLDAARQWLEARLAERPGNPRLLEQWATVCAASNRADDAIVRMRAIVGDEPDNIAAAKLLEQLLRQTNQVDEATELAARRLATRPIGVRRELELAAIYASAGQTSQALQHVRWIIDSGDHASLQHHLSALAILERMPAEAEGADAMRLALARRTIDRFPDAPLVVYGVALEALARQDDSDSQLDALVALALQRSAEAADGSRDGALRWRYLAQRLVDGGNPAAAARVLRARLLSDPPLQELPWTVIINATFAADAATGGQAEQSLALLRRVNAEGRLHQVWTWLDQPPSLAEAVYQLSLTYATAGDDEGVALLLDETIRIQPDHVMALNNRGYTRIVNGDGDAVTAAMIERAFALDPRNESITDTLAWLRYRQGRWDDEPAPPARAPAGAAGGASVPGAVTLLRQALTLGEQPVAEVHDHLGDALWRTGDRDGALEAWSRAVSLLEDPAHRQGRLQMTRFVQTQLWHLLVVDPDAIYDREYLPLLERLRTKLQAVEQGAEPPVAPTFAELAASKNEAD